MTPDEVVDLFTAATTAYEKVSSRPTFADIDRFDEKINSILVEIPRDHDGDEFGMLYLSQDPSEHGAITGGSALSKIGPLAAYDSAIDASASDAERKKAEVLCKVKLNDSKVEAAAERGAKKMLLATFDDTCTNKIKHPIKLYAGVSCFNLIEHLRETYRKLHQLNISDLLKEMSSYFDINEGFTRHIERMKEAQKTASTIDANLINGATLLHMGIEAMHECGLFEKALDKWEERTRSHQTWSEFQTHFQEVEEKVNLKKNINDKKGGLGQANAVNQEGICQPCPSSSIDMTKMDTHLDNLAAAASQEKDVLDQLVANNTSLIKQLEVLTSKVQQLSGSGTNSSTASATPMFNGKRLKFVQHEKNGYCFTHGCRCIKGHSSKTCSKPNSQHQQDATREDAKGGSTKNKDWICSHCEEKGFWVPAERN